MKIATYNVNGVNGRLPVLLRWLAEVEARRRLPAGAEGAGREVPASPPSARRATRRSGTARRAGTASPSSPGARAQETRRGLPGDPDDTHSRYIEAVGGRRHRRLPLPAQRQPGPGPEVRLQAEAGSSGSRRTRRACSSTGRPVVLAGDYNVIPTELDVYKPERWVDDALFLPECARPTSASLAQGWTDALRRCIPGERSTPSGTTSGTPSPATRASASTTCC